MPHMYIDGTENIPILISQITLAYNNEMIINLLRKRGNAIKAEKYKELEKVNDELAKEIKNQKTLDDCQRPCSAFVMFETEEGVTRANYLLEYAEENKMKFMGDLLGEPFDIFKASEPSDIIWENRHFSKSKRR